jgi:hypothetical protein
MRADVIARKIQPDWQTLRLLRLSVSLSDWKRQVSSFLQLVLHALH